jgi:hypothetical protein
VDKLIAIFEESSPLEIETKTTAIGGDFEDLLAHGILNSQKSNEGRYYLLRDLEIAKLRRQIRS